ncbi:MAG: prolipoprotein diacylglyceryl transferase [Rickettsiales bacterium]
MRFPDIDPVAISIGSFVIRWYSLAYLGGILLGWWLVISEHKKRPLKNLTKAAIDDMVVWAALGIILGGRLGYVFFYKPDYYLTNIPEIFYVWKGGMSFHGGLIGVIFSFYLFCRKYKINFLSLADLLACAAPIGLFFGRLANFANGELFGRVTDSPLGMVFPRGGELPRHPSQLYEASLEGFVLFFILLFLLKKTNMREKTGYLSGVFLILYSFARIFCEFFREPDAFIGFLYNGATMGQLLSVPMILVGLYLIFGIKRKKYES